MSRCPEDKATGVQMGPRRLGYTWYMQCLPHPEAPPGAQAVVQAWYMDKPQGDPRWPHSLNASGGVSLKQLVSLEFFYGSWQIREWSRIRKDPKTQKLLLDGQNDRMQTQTAKFWGKDSDILWGAFTLGWKICYSRWQWVLWCKK